MGETINRFTRPDSEKKSVKDLMLAGKSNREVMEELYGGFKTGCNDYHFVLSMRRELKAEGLLGIEVDKISSTKQVSGKPKSKLADLPNENNSSKEVIAMLDSDIARCEKRLKYLKKMRDLLS